MNILFMMFTLVCDSLLFCADLIYVIVVLLNEELMYAVAPALYKVTLGSQVSCVYFCIKYLHVVYRFMLCLVPFPVVKTAEMCLRSY